MTREPGAYSAARGYIYHDRPRAEQTSVASVQISKIENEIEKERSISNSPIGLEDQRRERNL